VWSATYSAEAASSPTATRADPSPRIAAEFVRHDCNDRGRRSRSSFRRRMTPRFGRVSIGRTAATAVRRHRDHLLFRGWRSAPPRSRRGRIRRSSKALRCQTEYVAKVGGPFPGNPAGGASPARARRSGRPIMQSSKARPLGKPEIDEPTEGPVSRPRGAGIRRPVAVLDGPAGLSNTVRHGPRPPVFVLRQPPLRVPGRGATVPRGILDQHRNRRARSRASTLVDKHHEPNAFSTAHPHAGLGLRRRLQLAPSFGIDGGRSQPVSSNAFRGPRAVSPTRRCGRFPSSDTPSGPAAGGGAGRRLWAHGISGGSARSSLLRINDGRRHRHSHGSWLRAHEYWRMKQLAVDLVS